MIEHLNYCRHMTKQLSDVIKHSEADTQTKQTAIHLIDLASASHKFILPPDGQILEDDELRGLDGIESIHLPHQFVALEYQPKNINGGKVIAFAREHENASSIAVTAVAFSDEAGCWKWIPTFHISKKQHHSVLWRQNGKCFVQFEIPEEVQDEIVKDLIFKMGSVVLGFLNALACSNVHITKSEPRKAGKKIKSALPFDTYHVLAIDVPGRIGDVGAPIGSHRSPREHLRRGHIRRLVDGRRIWVNATVVAAGHGAGVVKKDYALRMAA